MENNNPIFKNYLVAIDFDGVIWNSVDECFRLGYRVFREMEGPAEEDESFLMEQFRKGRFLAKNGDDFFITLMMMKENPHIDFNQVTPFEYQARRRVFPAQIAEFSGKFYAERHRMMQEDWDTWISWQGPYPGIMEQLPVISDTFFGLAICSTKDKKSIKTLLSSYGQDYTVFGREYSRYKPDQIKALAAQKGVSIERIIFIDDLMENLGHVHETGALCVMNDWGYNNPGERQRAKEMGFPIISLEDVTGGLKTAVSEKFFA